MNILDDRLSMIKKMLSDSKMEPIIDNIQVGGKYDSAKYDSNKTGETNSYDTRILLNKKILDIKRVIEKMNGELKYIKSGSTGHTFKGICINGDCKIEYGVKVVAYPRKSKYGNVHESRRPENAELMMIRLLSSFIINKATPHIILPISTFNTPIINFTNLIELNAIDANNKKYKQFLSRYKDGEYYDQVSILVSEWANCGDLLDYIRNNYKHMDLMFWKVIFFQLFSTLATIQSKYPSFRHNDMKANNILLHKLNDKDTSKNQAKKFKYTVAGYIFRVPNIGYHIKLWDFDFACIPGVVDNLKVNENEEWNKSMNVTPIENKYYDIHYFFNTLYQDGFFPDFFKSDCVPLEIKNFVKRVIPQKYRCGKNIHPKGYRLLVNEEYVTPLDILLNDKLFNEFKKNDKVNYNDTLLCTQKFELSKFIQQINNLI